MNSKRSHENTIVFGAYSAIAFAWAELRAAEGDNFVLVGRRPEPLELAANHLRTKYAVEVHTVVADLANADACAQIVERAFAAIQGPVHRVLLAHGFLGEQATAQQNWELANKIITSNLTSHVALMTRISPKLKAQGLGTLICISSVAGDRGRASNFVYGSAKAGLSAYLSGLRAALRGSGVHVITVKPGMVDSPMTSNLKKGLLFSKPATVAQHIFNAETKKKCVVYTPCWWRLIMTVIAFIPERIFMRLRF